VTDVDAQDALDLEFATTIGALVEMLIPTATREVQLEAKAKFATMCSNTMLQTVHHISGQSTPWHCEERIKIP
jgi:hypothetical protein